MFLDVFVLAQRLEDQAFVGKGQDSFLCLLFIPLRLPTEEGSCEVVSKLKEFQNQDVPL